MHKYITRTQESSYSFIYSENKNFGNAWQKEKEDRIRNANKIEALLSCNNG